MVVIVMAGCAALHDRPPEESLRPKVEQLVALKTAGRWDQVYGLYDSGFRKAISREAFLAGPKDVKFDACRIGEIVVAPDGKTAVATVENDVTVMGFHLKGIIQKQQWIREDGKWRLQVDPYSNPITGSKQKAP